MDAFFVNITATFLWLADKGGGVVLRSLFSTWVMISALHTKNDGLIQLLADSRMAKKTHNRTTFLLEARNVTFLGHLSRWLTAVSQEYVIMCS